MPRHSRLRRSCGVTVLVTVLLRGDRDRYGARSRSPDRRVPEGGHHAGRHGRELGSQLVELAPETGGLVRLLEGLVIGDGREVEGGGKVEGADVGGVEPAQAGILAAEEGDDRLEAL